MLPNNVWLLLLIIIVFYAILKGAQTPVKPNWFWLFVCAAYIMYWMWNKFDLIWFDLDRLFQVLVSSVLVCIAESFRNVFVTLIHIYSAYAYFHVESYARRFFSYVTHL